MRRDLEFEHDYPFPIEDVWWALTDPVALGEWLMPNDFQPVVGHRFQFRTKPAPGFDGVVHCEVLRLERLHVLSYSWRGGGIDTVVTFTLRSVPGGTSLRLEHRGFEGIRGLMASLFLGSGWRSRHMRDGLQSVLARRREMG
jgi:uncharacterized protein YndB with AHSA1/START domain